MYQINSTGFYKKCLNKYSRFIFKLLFFSVFFNATSLSAQNVWTLQKCLDYAMKNNISIQQNILAVATSNEKITQSYAAFLPNLNGNIGHSYDYGRYVNPFTNTFANTRAVSENFSLSSNMTLFNGFQMQNTLKQSKLDYVSSEWDLKKIANDISLNVVSNYLQVLFAMENLAVANQQLDLIKKQQINTKNLFDAGSVAKGSLLEINAQVATDELSVITAQNGLDIAYLNLQQLLDLDSVKDFTIDKPILELPSGNITTINSDQIFASAEKTLPEIKSADSKYQSSLVGLSIARGGRSPRLSLSGSIGTGYSDQRESVNGYTIAPPLMIGVDGNGIPVYSVTQEFIPTYVTTPFSDQWKDNVNKTIGLNLSLPFFNNWSAKSNIVRAKITVQTAKYTSDLARLTLKKSIEQAYLDATAAYKKYNATVTSVESLQEAFKYAQQKFDVGLLNSYDYLAAKNNLTKAESDLIQAKYDYIFKAKILDFYQGKSLTF
jgi:outer membrane protein